MFKIEEHKEYQLDFSDEFDGTELDLSVWELCTPYTRVVADKETTTDCKHITVKDGKLYLGSSKDENGVYHNGEIFTKRDFSHGYFEAKLKVPAGKGYFPAFWGKKAREFSPLKGFWNEIDIFECFGTDDEYCPAIHFWYDKYSKVLPDWVKNCDKSLSWIHEREINSEIGLSHDNYPIKGLLSDKFHVFGCEWTSECLTFYLDGEQYYKQEFNIHGKYPEHFTNFREGDPINMYLSNLVGVNNILPADNNIGNSLEVEYFRYYKPAN